MSKLIIETTAYSKVLQCAHDSDPSAFYVGEDKRAVSGGRLTAKAGDGVVVVNSNSIGEEHLREIFAAFLPKTTGDEE